MVKLLLEAPPARRAGDGPDSPGRTGLGAGERPRCFMVASSEGVAAIFGRTKKIALKTFFLLRFSKVSGAIFTALHFLRNLLAFPP